MNWSQNEVEQFTFELANTDISSLLDEIQVMEDAVAEAALFPEFREHFRHAFDVINEAASYRLEEGLEVSTKPGAIQTWQGVAPHARSIFVRLGNWLFAFKGVADF